MRSKANLLESAPYAKYLLPIPQQLLRNSSRVVVRIEIWRHSKAWKFIGIEKSTFIRISSHRLECHIGKWKQKNGHIKNTNYTKDSPRSLICIRSCRRKIHTRGLWDLKTFLDNQRSIQSILPRLSSYHSSSSRWPSAFAKHFCRSERLCGRLRGVIWM